MMGLTFVVVVVVLPHIWMLLHPGWRLFNLLSRSYPHILGCVGVCKLDLSRLHDSCTSILCTGRLQRKLQTHRDCTKTLHREIAQRDCTERSHGEVA